MTNVEGFVKHKAAQFMFQKNKMQKGYVVRRIADILHITLVIVSL